MAGDRRTAAAVGVLFIVATGADVAGHALHVPFLGSGEVLASAFPNRGRVVAGVLIELVGVLAIPLIALVFYPLLRRRAEGLALAYVGLRIMEAAALLVVDANQWAMVSLSEAFHTGASASGELAVQLATLQAVNGAAFLFSVALIFPVGSALLNGVLWRTRMVPRVLAGWGVAGASLLLFGSLLEFFGALPDLSRGLLETVLSGPIALQEMALAGWLIAKGVDTSTGDP